MSGALEWPAGAQLTAEARREISAEHFRHERAAPAAAPPTASARRLDAAEQRIAKLERFNAKLLPDLIAKAMADLAHSIEAKDTEGIRAKVGEALAEMYQGVWDISRKFTQGALVTSDGSLWLSLIASKGLRPGSSNGAWRLVAKGYSAARKKDSAP